MIRAWVADAAGAREIEPAGAAARACDGDGRVWIDIEGEDEAAVRAALEPLEVHPLVLEDMVVESNRPKVDDYGPYLYLVIHTARWEEARPLLKELDMLIGARFLITYHDAPTRSVTAAHEVLARRPELLARGPATLLHWMLDQLVDHYFPVVERINEEIDELEERLFDDGARATQAQVLRIKRGLAALRRIVGPERDTLLALTRDEYRAIPPELRPYLRDVYDRLARVTDLLDSFRDELATLLELHVAITSNRLNNVIRRLTVIATIGLPLTVVTSYYGMNVRLAVYQWRHGELFVIAVLAITALATWVVLRWKRWL